MKSFNIIYIILAVSLSFMGCKKALEPKTDSSYGADVVWSLPDQAQAVLLNAYTAIPNRYDNFSGNNFLDAATDNAVTNSFGSAIAQIGAGSISSQDNQIGNWSTNYNQLRNINLFLDNGLTDKITYDITSAANDLKYKQRLKGEALFLRAYWSFRLLQQYGGKTNDGQALGYPILIRTLTDEEARNTNISRNTYEDCVLQIIKDIDEAQTLLPFEYVGSDNIVGLGNRGRANQQSCAALRVRVAVYGASPAYQPNSITQITTMGQFSVTNPALYNQKWVRATTFAAAAMTLVGNFTSLKTSDFNSVTTPGEFIWRRTTNNRATEAAQYPPYNYGGGTTGPSQNLVDAFPALNGYPITDPRSNYDNNNPYASRDPRLDLTIYHNNSAFDGRLIQTFDGGLDANTTFPNATRTGYYVRKWLSVKSGILNPETGQNDFHYFVMLRKSEIYLNYAEAANEAYGPNVVPPGATMSAATVIRNIRTAAGLTAASSNAYVTEVALLGKDSFRKLIQNEVRLTFAFENYRYFNMRRWVLPLNEAIRGTKITKVNNTTFTYQGTTVEPRSFNDIRYYYLPLPYAELSKSPGLINNMGW
jgi:hypothetical protein